MPPAIKNIGVKFMKSPHHVKIKAKEMTADLIDQYYVRAKEYEKFDIMTRLFDVQTPELTIVFGRTKRRVDELARGLEARGYRAEGIHGDLSQQKTDERIAFIQERSLRYPCSDRRCRTWIRYLRCHSCVQL